MLFEHAYKGSSSVRSQGGQTGLNFVPDAKREPTFFRGELANHIAFREAISALNAVVVSDMRFQPKDRTEYLQWYEQQQWIDFEKVAQQSRNAAEKISALNRELRGLNRDRYTRMKPFHTAQNRYFRHLFVKDRDAWFVLDPVITVHPDQLFFECFSQDESSYGCLSVDYDGFQKVGEFACGTTNIDYSAALYNEFQKIRSYKKTVFEIDPSGFQVETTNEADFKELKIDLPDSWVRGFLQVSSAMALNAVEFELSPMDLQNICFMLRRKKESRGPRSLRYVLEPGKPIRILFEPWNDELVCERSIYKGDTAQEVRVWGRRRIHQLERLIPLARRFLVRLLGTGMPSFYVADLGGMSFTLGLSGWSANDWSQSANFDLLAPRQEVDDVSMQQVGALLKTKRFATADNLAAELQLDRKLVLGALSAYTQAGRCIYDLTKSVYRSRELCAEPLPMEQLRFSNNREKSASEFVRFGKVRQGKIEGPMADGTLRIHGSVQDAKYSYEPVLTIDGDARMVEASCTCNFFQQNRLYKGPCEHILAIRILYNKRY